MEQAGDQPGGDGYVYALTDEEAYLQTDDEKPAIVAEPPSDLAQFKCWFCRKSYQQVRTLFGAEYPGQGPQHLRRHHGNLHLQRVRSQVRGIAPQRPRDPAVAAAFAMGAPTVGNESLVAEGRKGRRVDRERIWALIKETRNSVGDQIREQSAVGLDQSIPGSITTADGQLAFPALVQELMNSGLSDQRRLLRQRVQGVLRVAGGPGQSCL